MPKTNSLTESKTVTVARTKEEKKQKENDRKREQKERKARRALTTTDNLTSSAVPADAEIHIPVPIPVPHSPPPPPTLLPAAPTDIPLDPEPEPRSAHVIPGAHIYIPDVPQFAFDAFGSSLNDDEQDLIASDEAISHLLERALRMGWDAGVTFGLFSVGKEVGKDEDINAEETVREFSTAEIQTDSTAVILPLQDPSSLAPEEPLVQPVAAARRDLTSLQTGIPRPFGTLQRRLARSRRHLRHAQKNSVPVPIHYPTSQQPPFRASDSKPTIPTPDIILTHRRVRGPRRVLDWDRDPLLSDLGRALGALGWIRGGG